MKITLIGGNGFIGSHVVQRLQQAGHTLTVLDSRPPRFPYEHQPLASLCGDYADPAVTTRAIAGAGVVVHLGCSSTPRTSNDDPSADAEANLLPAVRLAEACRAEGVGRLVFLSSGGAVYGPPTGGPFDERHPTEPTSAYGVVKLAIEKYLQVFHRLHGLEYTVLRPANPYGERQDPRGKLGFIAVALGKCASGEPLELMGDGSVRKDFFYVGDLAEAVARAVEGGSRGIYNVGSGRTVSLNQVIDLVRDVTRKPLQVIRTPGSPTDVPDTPLSIEKARRELGWEPSVDLCEGIERTWAWVRSLTA